MKFFKWIFAVTLLLVVVGAVFIFQGLDRVAHYAVVNKSGEMIVRAVVSVCGQKVEFESIPQNDSVTAKYEANCEGYYTVEVEFQSGRKFRQDEGYVRPDVDFGDVITIAASGVTVVSEPSSRIKITVH